MSGLPHRIEFYELWHIVCACVIKITQLLLSTSRDAASQKNANSLTVIRKNLRATGFPQPPCTRTTAKYGVALHDSRDT